MEDYQAVNMTDETVSGTVDSIIYQNQDNNYTVCEIENECGDPVVLVGIIPYLSEGDRITAYGTWTSHPTYGKQFKVEYFEKTLPSEKDDILRYLSGGAVKGIGPKTAQRIVDKFGTDTFDVIENHPDWLSEINGITQKRAAAISESFRAISSTREIMMFCRGFFSPTTAIKIYKQWGGSAVEKIKANPFRLCSDFYGISFKKADHIAEMIGIGKDNAERIRSGIAYILSNEAQRNGHTCLSKSDLLSFASDLLGVGQDKLETEILNMIKSDDIASVLINGTRMIALHKYLRAEKFIAKKLMQLNKMCVRVDAGDTGRLIFNIENTHGIKYAAMQRKAIETALLDGVMILTGGPGTGKTTVIRGLISIFDSLGLDVALAAPTGRAAKRMSEATSYEAMTVHRLLEMEYNENDEPKFVRNQANPLDAEVFIIDESSMIDVMLLEAFLWAVKPGARVIFIGDSDQLPSVGAGNVLADLISSGTIATADLVEIFRQSSESLIVTNAHAINSGIYPNTDVKNNDFFFLPRQTDEEIASTIASLYTVRLPKSYGADIVQKIQIISPSRKGAAGTAALNYMLQAALNPASQKKNERRRGDTVFREGDKIMQIKNNYTIEWKKDETEGVGVFNGDIGVIEEIDCDSETVTVNFDDRIAEYGFDTLDELEHAYAITVHKSQGCEYPVVIVPLYQCPPMLQTRNLLYTAITRASKMVILVGRRDVLYRMVDNNTHTVRMTMLEQFLKEEYK